MENASKALIIAGAILISILIIGLGVYFYNMAASTGKKVDLTSQEAQAHNEAFSAYFGNRKSATEIKALCNTISSNNITGAKAEDTRTIYILFNGEYKSPSSVSRSVKTGTTYWVGVLNDVAPTDEAAETEEPSKTDADEPAYYSNAYIRVICINAGGPPAGIDDDTSSDE